MALTKVIGAGAEGLTLSSTSLTVANGLTLTDGNVTLASGHGIDFAANSSASGMTSELMNDYEIGSWTPTYIVDSGSNPTVSYNAASTVGFYAKIGAFVHVQGRIRTTATSGGSGNLVIGGLPFVCFTGGNGNEFSAFNIGFSNQWAADNYPVGGYVPPNQSYIFLIKGRSDDHRQGIGLVISVTSLTDGTNKNDLLFSAAYRTD